MLMLDQLKSPATCLFVQWTRPNYRYLLVKRGPSRPRLLMAGSFEHTDDATVLERMQQEIVSRGGKLQQAVVLLSRGDLEVATLRLPPATADEIPELVQNMVAQTAEDSTHPPVTDFVVVNHGEDGSHEALAFTCSTAAIDELSDRFKARKTRLIGITFGGFGAVQLLKQVSTHPAHTAVVVTTTDHDTDLSVVIAGQPVLFRTIPRPTTDDQLFVQPLCEEIRRTLTLVGHPEDDPTRVYLIGTVDEQGGTAKALSDRLSLSVSLVNPFDQLSGSSGDRIDHPARFANLIGIACGWNRDALELDLLNPRRPPVQPGPWRRIAWGSVVAASVLVFFGFLGWRDFSNQLTEIDEYKTKLRNLAKRANKGLELQDIVGAVNRWRDDDIAWLDELRDLAQKLPPAHEARVRRMTMSTDSRRNGVIDLAVQVSSPQVVTQLEDAVRNDRHSVSSKRVTDTSESSDLRWQFETRIVFTPAEKPPLPVPADDVDVQTTESDAEPVR